MADDKNRKEKKRNRKYLRKRIGVVKATGRRIQDIVQNIKDKPKKSGGKSSDKGRSKSKVKRTLSNQARKDKLRDTRKTGLRKGQSDRLKSTYEKETTSKKDIRTIGRLEGKKNQYDSEGKMTKRTLNSKRAGKKLDNIDRREQRRMKKGTRRDMNRLAEDQAGPNARNSSQGMQCGPKGCDKK